MKETLKGWAATWGEGRYQLVEELGRGAMGLVFRAIDHDLQSEVAIKTVRTPDVKVLYRLKQEFRALADLSHRNLVSLYELGREEDRWYFTMELLNGVNFVQHVHGREVEKDSEQGSSERQRLSKQALNQLLRLAASEVDMGDTCSTANLLPAEEIAAAKARMNASRAGQQFECDYTKLRAALTQLVEGVAALHDFGLLHRDLKPSNVLVEPDGRVVILDFGVVTELSAYRTKDIAGTIGYIAPEIIRGDEPTTAADWYALGVILYECITGRIYNEGDATLDALKVAPQDMADLCRGLLAADPNERADYRDLCAALNIPPRSGAFRRRAVQHGTLTGRTEELEALNRAFARSHNEPGLLTLVHGRSGAGKSALVSHFLDTQRDAGTLVFQGRCYEQEHVPYKGLDAIVDAMARHITAMPDAAKDQVFMAQVAEAARVFRVLESCAPETNQMSSVGQRDPRHLRRAAFIALREVIWTIAAKEPLILLLDDLQWGDLDSIPLLRALLDPQHAGRVMFLGVYRDEDEARSPLLRQLFDRSGTITEASRMIDIKVGPLDDARAEGVLASDPRTAELPEAQRKKVIAESKGLPYFLVELGAFAAEKPEDDELSFAGMMQHQMRTLEDSSRDALLVAAVAGRPLSRSLLTHVCSLKDPGRVMHTLRSRRLLTSVQGDETERVECYHDRIRETIGKVVDDGARAQLHLRIAQGMETLELDAPDMLAQHYALAGDQDKAATHARAAAEAAEKALAFSRAADLYTALLEYESDETSQALDTRRSLANALAAAGRNKEAADEFIAIAETALASERAELRRKAGRAFISSGHVEQGLAIMRDLLEQQGVPLPKTPLRAVFKLLWTRSRIKKRGLHYLPREISDDEQATVERLDTLWDTALSTVWSDNIRSAYMLARCLQQSLEFGDEERIARSLCLESGFRSIAGEKAYDTAFEPLDLARQLFARTQSPYLSFFVPMSDGNFHFQCSGDFEACVEACELAIERIGGQSTYTFESVNARSYAMWALYYLGRPDELRRHITLLTEDARARGDRHAITAARTGLPSFAWLAEDDPDAVRQSCQTALKEWSSGSATYIQHYWAVFGQAQAELYDGNAQAAYDIAVAGWARLKKAMLLRLDTIRMGMAHLRARCAVAMAAQAANPKPYLKEAEKFATMMGDRTMHYKVAGSLMTRAGIASVSGDKASAIASLQEAEHICKKGSLALLHQASRRARGCLMGGSEGDQLVAEADDHMRRLGVVRPDRIAALLCPIAPESP